jgi:hypothetical protein
VATAELPKSPGHPFYFRLGWDPLGLFAGLTTAATMAGKFDAPIIELGMMSSRFFLARSAS